MIHDSTRAHFNMLEQQIRPSEVSNPRVLKALDSFVRSDFVEPYLAGLAYADTDLPIGYGQVMLSPVLHGRLLQALDIQPNEDVLEIGTGNGYFTALLATLAKHVITVEIVTELSTTAQQRLSSMVLHNVMFHVGDASRGWSLPDRIDVIVATAAFVDVPDDYLQSLKINGRMLVIVGEGKVMTVQLIRRVSEREWQTDTLFETVAPYMINAEPKPEFKF